MEGGEWWMDFTGDLEFNDLEKKISVNRLKSN
jgi:hypothetical protein